MPEGLVYVSRTPLPPPGVAPLSAAGLRIRQHAHDTSPSRTELQFELMAADAAIVTLSERIDAELLANAPALKVIANIGAGHDNIDVAAANAQGIVVTYTPDVLTEATADLAWALLLATARKVVEGDAFVRSGRFEGPSLSQFLGAKVSGATLAVMGMGRIGTAVARRARGFGMDIVFTSRTVKRDLAIELGAEQTTVIEALSKADFVVITSPLSHETHHLINADALAAMKPTAILVNVGRGPVVDEAALVEALRRRRIGGAGLDVYEREPNLAPGLAELENVVLTPHIGSATRDTRGAMIRLCCDNVIAVLEGREPLTPVVL